MTGSNDLLRFAPQCTFHVRTPVDNGLLRYDRRYTEASGDRDGYVPFLTPPSLGDLVLLWNPDDKSCETYRVVERDWSYAAHGSAAWPYSERTPTVGPILQIIVEAAEGPFRDEAPPLDLDEGNDQ